MLSGVSEEDLKECFRFMMLTFLFEGPSLIIFVYRCQIQIYFTANYIKAEMREENIISSVP